MRRYDRLKHILRLDPEKDSHEIYRLIAAYEFPWDIARALELALYRTYAVPSIGRLLAETAELTDRTQRRYDDTSLLLDAVVEHGFDSVNGRTAIRRINQMHRTYDISNDDMRYVLCTFVVTPKRWLDAFGWRRLTPHELRATAHYYSTLGRHMGIQDVPVGYAEFEKYLNDYEDANYGWDEGARKVSDSTLDLMASWYPAPLAPAVRTASKALLDDSLLRAFRYARPSPTTRRLVRGALRLRGRGVRLLPPRDRPHFGRQNREIKSYPGYPVGYQVADLGAFGGGTGQGKSACPVPHAAKGQSAIEEKRP
ncbi:oxygenase MpaB family protein [Streptomyces iconiensis]|uniref:Oxygenase MpaB family protein n=1 Tax=Streptomyces iconiensis TaxID=1384038 RepID=A0ABT6ZV50_9ACTN|nr:oxygenase MpaB family protein [Streptomyces iconiensis]MDJ1132929.1 oxygenase MpaB family protein [Streptomyces iconiensis]